MRARMLRSLLSVALLTVGVAGTASAGPLDEPIIVDTPTGPVCVNCEIATVLRVADVLAPANKSGSFTIIGTDGKPTVYTPDSGPPGGAAPAAASSSCGSTFSCSNSRLRWADAGGFDNTNVNLYLAVALVQPSWRTDGHWYMIGHIQSAVRSKNDATEVYLLHAGVWERKSANGKIIPGWRPSGSADWGSPHDYSFQVGGQVSGNGFNIGFSWTTYPGEVEGRPPAAGGKLFNGVWRGEMQRKTAPWEGAATYQIPYGQSGYFEFRANTYYKNG